MTRELRRNEWVTITEAARRMATNHWRIRKWIERGDIPRRGNTYLYRALEETENRIRHEQTVEAN